MAGGFIRGVIHGTAFSAVVLTGLSLALPLSERGAPAPVATEPTQPLDQAVMPDAAAPSDLAVDPSGDREGTQGAPGSVLDLPVGSEFGRAGDLPPRLPDSVTGPATPLPATTPLIAPRAGAERAPVATTGATDRPETAADPEAPAQPTTQPDSGRATIILPQTSTAPQAAPAIAPSLVPGPSRDSAPVTPLIDLSPVTETPAADPSEALPGGAAQTPPALPPATAPVAIPRLHAPALDLSLPPDLGELRRLERD